MNLAMEWCRPCLEDGVKVSAAIVLAEVPVCKACAQSFAEELESLGAFRGKPEVDVPEPAEDGAEQSVSDPIEILPEIPEAVVVKDKSREAAPPPVVSLAEKQAAMKRKNMSMTHTRQRQVIETEKIEMATNGQERESQLRIALPSGGELTLRFEGHLFSISREDRNFMFSIIDRMRDYARQRAVPMPVKPFTILGTLDGAWLGDMFDCLDQKEQEVVIKWLKEAAEVVEERKA